MDIITVYQCQKCFLTYTTKNGFEKHGVIAKHDRCAVIRLPLKKWEELKKKYSEKMEGNQ